MNKVVLVIIGSILRCGMWGNILFQLNTLHMTLNTLSPGL